MIVLTQNKRLLLGVGVCLFILIIEVAMLASMGSRLSKQKKLLVRNQQQLERLNKRIPFPSMENVRLLKNNESNMEPFLVELENELTQDPFPSDVVESADFSARAQNVIERFKKRAKMAGVALPESLEAGFAKYTSGGVVPDAAFVPRLCRQLYSVERIADVLVQSRVESIDSLTRDEFEVAVEPVPEAPRRRRPYREPLVVDIPHPSSESAGHSSSIYAVERIKVSFTGKEAAVWRVLSLISIAPHCMAVTGFSHSTQSTILSYDPEVVRQGADSESETIHYLSEGILVGKTALSRPERIIAGEELIRVKLVVDVYDFAIENAVEGIL